MLLKKYLKQIIAGTAFTELYGVDKSAGHLQHKVFPLQLRFGYDSIVDRRIIFGFECSDIRQCGILPRLQVLANFKTLEVKSKFVCGIEEFGAN